VGAPAGHPPVSTRSSGQRYPSVSGSEDRRAGEDDVIEFLLHGEDNPSSILAAVSAARENLRTARPVVPREAWEAGHNLWLNCSDYLDEAQSRKGRVQWFASGDRTAANGLTVSCSAP